jgi:hypothetical protein
MNPGRFHVGPAWKLSVKPCVEAGDPGLPLNAPANPTRFRARLAMQL